MRISFGNGQTYGGPGVQIDLTGDEVAIAISAFLHAHNVIISGPRTIRVNGDKLAEGSVYVDPSGFVMNKGTRWRGNGIIEP